MPYARSKKATSVRAEQERIAKAKEIDARYGDDILERIAGGDPMENIRRDYGMNTNEWTYWSQTARERIGESEWNKIRSRRASATRSHGASSTASAKEDYRTIHKHCLRVWRINEENALNPPPEDGWTTDVTRSPEIPRKHNWDYDSCMLFWSNDRLRKHNTPKKTLKSK